MNATTMFFAMNISHEYNVLNKKYNVDLMDTYNQKMQRVRQISKIKLLEKRMLLHLNKKYSDG